MRAIRSSSPDLTAWRAQLCIYVKSPQIAEELRRKTVELQVIDQNINTADATGRLLFNMLRAINQFETKIRAERQTDGIKKAKEKGVRLGAKKKSSVEQIKEMQAGRKNGILIRNLMSEYKLSKASGYRYLSELTKSTEE